MKKSFIAKVMSVLLVIMLIMGIVCLFFLPNLYNYFKDSFVSKFQDQSTLYQVAFFTCYIICLVIVFKLTKLFHIIYKDSPFRKEIESSLKIMAILFMSLSLIVIIKAIFIPTLLSFVVSLLCFLIALSFYVLASVIKVAIEYKNEVDLTI